MATRRQNRHRWRAVFGGSVHGVIFDDKGIVQDIEYQNLAGPATRLLKVFEKDKSSHNKSRESNIVFVQSCSLNGCLLC